MVKYHTFTQQKNRSFTHEEYKSSAPTMLFTQQKVRGLVGGIHSNSTQTILALYKG
jgi:hypothetical protein